MYSPALLVDEQPLVDPGLLAAAGFLAGYTGTTREGYTIDLKHWWTFCEMHGLPVLDAKRAHLDLYVRSLEERGYAKSTIGRRISTVASFYRWCLEEEVVERNPAAHVRRPKVSQESTTLGLDRAELGAFLVQAGLVGGRDHALACLLGLNGLRVSEACGADIDKLGFERGHHTLIVDRKGGKRAIIPLAPRTYRAVAAVIGERHSGPILLGNDGERLDRFAAYRIVRRIAKRAGIAHPIHPHSLRHAFITAALDAGVPLRDVQEAASHADPRTTMRYDRNRQSLDRHAAYTVATFVAGATDAQ
ncbi:MAG TPA: tyrosine-type recombinase/integrase [Acidimicrobiia bacterium]|nr:tyrosine-type recombinase/integrase [Acidimicrobiia bacterium]